MRVSNDQRIFRMSGSNEDQLPSNQIMGKDDFLKLLVTQLVYQDPLSPVDDQEFIAQTAQFSALEQMQNLNESFKSLMRIEGQINRALSLGFIGKQVRVQSGFFELKGDGPVELKYQVKGDPEKVTVKIFNDKGELIRTLEPRDISRGEHTVLWDGRNDKGERAESGSYRYEVTGVDKAGKEVSLTPTASGKVEGVSFKGEEVYLLVNGDLVPQSSLISIEG
ncbi:TPA: flagellar hook assembly protein FlgD [Candidatus Poribacteria bacterium]|nr:flagellar hook assembly protein FlgD [Candidatus Poribacteria bacterium]